MSGIETTDTAKEDVKKRIEKQKQEKKEQFEKEQREREERKLKARQRYNKHNQKSFWTKYQDYFAYAGLGAVVLLILYFNFTGDRRKYSQIPINEEEYIITHNDGKHTYTLGRNEHFEGHTMADVKGIINNRFSTKKTINKCAAKKLEDGHDLPLNFNFYEKYPECRTDEEAKFCSASYAEIPISIYRNRNCLAKTETQTKPSLEHLLACDKKFNTGCKGGFIANTVEYMSNMGLISDECWKSLEAKENECPTKETLSKCKKEYIDNFCVFESADEI